MGNFGVTVLCSAFNLHLLSWAGSLRSLSSYCPFPCSGTCFSPSGDCPGSVRWSVSFLSTSLRPQAMFHGVFFTTKRSSEAWHQVKTDFLLTNSADFEINPFMPNTYLHLYVFWCLFDEPVDGAMCTLGLAWKQTFRKHVQPTWYFCQWEEARESWREELDSSNLHSNACVQRRCAEVT